MFNIKKQIDRLYFNSILGNLSLTGAWVAILAARGFTLAQIGLAETCYHIASLLLEIPSGTLADVLGRKRMLAVSTWIRMLAGVIMILSGGLPAVCASIALYAAADSFASGTGEALAYDSLKEAGQEEKYSRYESNQLIIYRLFDGISTLCAGFALVIGYRLSYASGIITAAIQLRIISGLTETRSSRPAGKLTVKALSGELIACFRNSVLFLKRESGTCLFMLANALVGAADTLLLFFLQAKLPLAGISAEGLGPLLFAMQLGGILGAGIILKLDRMKYGLLFMISAGIVASGILLEHTGIGLLMAAGGFLAALADDALQVRTNTRLQERFPSEQRATLISVESFLFSVVMIVLSPLAGLFFTVW